MYILFFFKSASRFYFEYSKFYPHDFYFKADCIIKWISTNDKKIQFFCNSTALLKQPNRFTH